MTYLELKDYIQVRNHELNSDEILFVTDVTKHPQIDHMQYRDGRYEMWDSQGNYYWFSKRKGD